MAKRNYLRVKLKKLLPARYKVPALAQTYLPLFTQTSKRTLHNVHYSLQLAVGATYQHFELQSNLPYSKIEEIIYDELAQHFWSEEIYLQYKQLSQLTYVTSEEFWIQQRKLNDQMYSYLKETYSTVNIHKIYDQIVEIVEQVFSLHTDFRSKV